MAIINRNKKTGRFATKKSIDGNAKRVAYLRNQIDFTISPVGTPPDTTLSDGESVTPVSSNTTVVDLLDPVTPTHSDDSCTSESKSPGVYTASSPYFLLQFRLPLRCPSLILKLLGKNRSSLFPQTPVLTCIVPKRLMIMPIPLLVEMKHQSFTSSILLLLRRLRQLRLSKSRLSLSTHPFHPLH